MAYPRCLPLPEEIPCAGLWLSCRVRSRLEDAQFVGDWLRYDQQGKGQGMKLTGDHEIRHLCKRRDAACAEAKWDAWWTVAKEYRC